MRVEAFDEAEAFLARCDSYFRQTEPRTHLVVGVARSTAKDAYRLAVIDQGEVVGVAVRTPPWKLLVTPMPDGGLDLLLPELLARDRELPAVMLGTDLEAGFVDRWTTSTGATATRGVPQRLYVLEALQMPTGNGSLRRAGPNDQALATRWAHAFAADVESPMPTDIGEVVGRHIEQQHLYLWDVDGEVCAMAVGAVRGLSTARIGLVYTPPELRGRGFGSLVTAHLAKHLQGVATHIALFAETQNPTSNRIYQAIGFRAVADRIDVSFEYATSSE